MATGYENCVWVGFDLLERFMIDVFKKVGIPEADAAVCADDVPRGRPAPWMVYHCMQRLQVYTPGTVVKIGDTVADIEEGVNAGVWTVGVARTGNLIGLSEAEIAALSKAELRQRLEAARQQFRRAGAHFVVDSFADCLSVIDQINVRLEREGHP